MRYLKLQILIFGLIFFGCNQRNESKTVTDSTTDNSQLIDNSEDKTEIQNLIRQVLNWADTKNSIDLLPAISDSTDSIYIGFDMNKLKLNLDKLKETNLFSKEFIDNYNRTILTLDKNIKDKVYYDWLVGEMQTFGFSNNFNPWCYCQEIPYDDPNPWDLVEVTIIKLDKEKGELTWTWGKTDWRDIEYNFRVVKEDGKWKISYMKGFDYDENIKGDL